MIAARVIDREIRRFFRRLIEPESHAAPLPSGSWGLFVARNQWQRPVVTVEAGVWQVFEARDLVCRLDDDKAGIRWVASEAGRALYRRLSADAEPFQAQHRIESRRRVNAGTEDEAVVVVNETETPLGWLRSRKGPNGKPFLDAAQFEAGEKLRRDFTLAHMSPRVTVDWAAALTAGGKRKSPRDPAAMTDNVLAARTRLAKALDAAGPGLSDVLLAVCCQLEGLEAAERGFGWPRRSARIVLAIALDRLVAHYGMERVAR